MMNVEKKHVLGLGLTLIVLAMILAFCSVASAQSVIANVSYVGSNNSRISGLDSNGLSLELLGGGLDIFVFWV